MNKNIRFKGLHFLQKEEEKSQLEREKEEFEKEQEMLEKRKEEADQIKKEDDEKRKVGVQYKEMSPASYIMFGRFSIVNELIETQGWFVIIS